MSKDKEELLALVSRRDRGAFRILRKSHNNRSYLEISAWSAPEDGERRLLFLNVRKTEARALLQALEAACQRMGIKDPSEAIEPTEGQQP